MGRHLRRVATVVAVVTSFTVSGCSLSFDIDPMNGEPAVSPPTPIPTPSATIAPINDPRAYDATDPTTWTDRQLVAQTIFQCVSVSNIGDKSRAVRKGLGGVVFLGGVAPTNLARHITKLVGRAGDRVPPFIASDEEGGVVQRLADVIYPLRSAKTMGTWSESEVTRTAVKYGKAMKKLGVDMAMSPVADLDIPGHFIGIQSRAFSSTPAGAARSAIAWATGLESAGVAPVIKHWPGHGRATDTHSNPGIIPNYTQLTKSDLVPFDRAIAAGFTAVMVGHLESKGLTERGVPASRSPKALAILRDQIGPDGLIITDSLSMEAALVGVKHRAVEAVRGSLDAGVDVALICSGPSNIVERVAHQISEDGLTRGELVDKVRRILAWKKRFGVID
jgi:beta-N-acetylhexosaminidase